MGEITTSFEQLSPGLLVAIAALAVVELALMVAALVSIIRRPAERLNGPKWLWVLLVLFINIVGPIVYFIAGRKPAQVDVAPADTPDQGARAESIANVLYGDAATQSERTSSEAHAE